MGSGLLGSARAALRRRSSQSAATSSMSPTIPMRASARQHSALHSCSCKASASSSSASCTLKPEFSNALLKEQVTFRGEEYHCDTLQRSWQDAQGTLERCRFLEPTPSSIALCRTVTPVCIAFNASSPSKSCPRYLNPQHSSEGAPKHLTLSIIHRQMTDARPTIHLEILALF